MKVLSSLGLALIALTASTSSFAALDFSDPDSDTVPGFADNCKLIFNPSQLDTDLDREGDVCDPDDDNDGIPDDWEIANNLDPLSPIDADADADGDGVSNLEEYQQNTDPNQPPAPEPPPVPPPVTKYGWRIATPYSQLDLKNTPVDDGFYFEIVAPGGADFGVENSDLGGDFVLQQVRVMTFKLSLRFGKVKNLHFQLEHGEVPGGWQYPLAAKFKNSDWHDEEIIFDPQWTDKQAKKYGWKPWGEPVSFTKTMQDVEKLSLLGRGQAGLPTVLAFDDFTLAKNYGEGSAEYTHWIYPRSWQMLSFPCDAKEKNTVAEVIADDLEGEIGRNWVIYEIDSQSGRYLRLRMEDKLFSTRAYWLIVYGKSPRLLDMPQNCIDHCTQGLQQCAHDQGCSSIPIVTSATSAKRNAIGNPFNYPVSAADIALKAISGNCQGPGGCNLSQAAEAGFIWRVIQTFDKDSGRFKVLGPDDEIDPWSGFLMWVFPWAHLYQPEILIPAPPGKQNDDS